MRPTRISSPQNRPWALEQPAACSWAVSPPFSKPPALQQKPWVIEDGALSSSTSNTQRHNACPSKYMSPDTSVGPTRWHPRGYESHLLPPWPSIRLPARVSSAVSDLCSPHDDAPVLRSNPHDDTMLPTLEPCGNARLPGRLLLSSSALGATAIGPEAESDSGDRSPVALAGPRLRRAGHAL